MSRKWGQLGEVMLVLTMIRLSVALMLCLVCPLVAKKNKLERPLTIETSEIQEFEMLSEKRQDFIKAALALAAENDWLKYRFGSATPEKGGLDCSGATYYVMSQKGWDPPRTSAAQYLWVEEAEALTKVPKDTKSLDAPIFKDLLPGDLVFWSGTYRPTDGRKVNITHVGIYLGTEKDGRPVMVCSSRGRSYRGRRCDGYGVYDFKLPRASSKSKLVGYGPPPALK